MRIVRYGAWERIVSSTAIYLRSEIVSWLRETKEVILRSSFAHACCIQKILLPVFFL